MKVDYYHERPGSYTGNIIWPFAKRPRNGKFPSDHPAAPSSLVFGKAGDGQCGDSQKLSAFRERGYWASCFPEGDGITMRCKSGQNTDVVVRDIEEVFGWSVRVERGDTD